MKLNDTQAQLLRSVKIADDAWRKAKREVTSRARVIAAAEISGYSEARDQQVRLAFEAMVPKMQIGRDGLGTTSSTTVEDSLARTAAFTRVQRELANASSLLTSVEKAA